MRVTYFLGNGFDIGLGLKTRYLDFLPSYIKPHDEDSQLVRMFREYVSKEMSSDINTWGDAERRFGELPFSEFATQANMSLRDTILELDASFQLELESYLKKQQKDFERRLPAGVLKREFLTSAWALVEKALGARFGNSVRESLSMNFITLNYTNTLEHILGQEQGGSEVVSLLSDQDGNPFAFNEANLSSVCHAHGSIMNRFRLFGVNDASQITDEKAQAECATNGFLIKTEEDKHANVGARGRAGYIIDNTDVLVILGVSYGATDNYWWQEIVKRVISPSVFKVILSPYVRNPSRASIPGVEIVRANEERRRLFAGSDYGSDTAFMHSYEKKCLVLSYGPYKCFNGDTVFCDPLSLGRIKASLSGEYKYEA